MLRDSVVVVVVVVVVRTRPQAIPLAMITMRKSTHGFPFVSHIWVAYGAPIGSPSGRRSSAIIKCYSSRCVQNAECRLHTGGVGLSFLDRLIFLHSWWKSNENFIGVASVISRPATCQVSIAGEHFLVSTGVVQAPKWSRPRNDPQPWNDPQIDPEMIPTPKWSPLFFLSTPKWSPRN